MESKLTMSNCKLWILVTACIIALVATLGLAMRRNAIRDDGVTAHMALSMIGHAIDDYQKKRSTLPPAFICSDDGEPLLSWRVEILPSLGHSDLYGIFKLNERWDSPHNAALLEYMPVEYESSSMVPPTKQYHTLYQILANKDGPIDGCRGVRLGADVPRLSFTVLIVEARHGVPWTKPDDVPFWDENVMPELGGRSHRPVHVLMADGGVLSVPQKDVGKTILRAANRRNSGTWPSEE